MTAPPMYRQEKLEQAPTDVAELTSDESTSTEIWNALVTEGKLQLNSTSLGRPKLTRWDGGI